VEGFTIVACHLDPHVFVLHYILSLVHPNKIKFTKNVCSCIRLRSSIENIMTIKWMVHSL
jgi:hypothetical protein